MDEYIFTFSSAIADQGTLEAQLHSKNAKNLVSTPTTDERERLSLEFGRSKVGKISTT